MRTTIVLGAFFVCLGFAQAPSTTAPARTFFLTNLKTPADLTTVVTTLRTLIDIRDMSADEQRNAVVVRDTTAKTVAAEWLIHQLDQPAGGVGVSPDYKMTDESGELMRLFRVTPATSPADLTSMVTILRTIIDIQRLIPVDGSKVIAARSTTDKLKAAEWVFRQLVPSDGIALTTDSPGYPIAGVRPDQEEDVIRVLRLDPAASNATITSTVTAIRTIDDIQRLMPAQSAKALVLRATNEKASAAEWMVHDLALPSHPTGISEMKVRLDPKDPRGTDDVVRIFYVHGTETELADLVKQIRETAQIQRAMPLAVPGAVVVRGRADQMATAELVVKRFGSDVAGNAPLK